MNFYRALFDVYIDNKQIGNYISTKQSQDTICPFR